MPAANFLSVSVVCGPVSLPVADTGQTGCWDSVGTLLACLGLGHDGSFANTPQARSFTGPIQHATYTTDYTTTDNVTGLVWKSCSEGLSGTTCATGAATTATWIAAGLQCRALNDANAGAGYAGRKDWRLPTKKELESLPNYQVFNPAIDTANFPGTVASSYWSSSSHIVLLSSFAWAVLFYGGADYNTNKSSSFHVRCVSN